MGSGWVWAGNSMCTDLRGYPWVACFQKFPSLVHTKLRKFNLTIVPKLLLSTTDASSVRSDDIRVLPVQYFSPLTGNALVFPMPPPRPCVGEECDFQLLVPMPMETDTTNVVSLILHCLEENFLCRSSQSRRVM